MACVLDLAVSDTRIPPALFQGGSLLHLGRCSPADRENQVVAAPAVPADVGNCLRKIPDRPDLVVLSFLGTRFSRTPTRRSPGATRSSVCRDLSHSQCRHRPPSTSPL